MKIFFEASVLNKEFQGTYTYVKEILIELSKKNNLVIYLGVNSSKNIPSEILNSEKFIILEYFFENKFFQLNLEIPYLLFSKGIKHAVFQYVSPFFKIPNCNYYPVIHDVLFLDYPKYFSRSYSNIRKILFRISAKLSKKVFTVSQYSKTKISKHFNLEKNKIVVTPNGIKNSYKQFKYDKKYSSDYIFQNYGLRNYALYVSRIEQRKNQGFLLKYKKLIPQINLVFIGSMTFNNPELEKKINKDSNVYWFNDIMENDLAHFYNAANLFIYPSLAEGFGIPPLEAAFFKVPVLCSNSTAMKDFEFFNKTLFNPVEDISFKNAINHINNNTKYLDLIKNKVILKYDWKNTSEIIYNSFYNN